MGEAKKRGSYEQRVLAGQSKQEAEFLEREKLRKAKEDAMTEEDKAKRRRSRQLLAGMLTLVESSHM